MDLGVLLMRTKELKFLERVDAYDYFGLWVEWWESLIATKLIKKGLIYKDGPFAFLTQKGKAYLNDN